MRTKKSILAPVIALGLSIALSAGVFIGISAHKDSLKVEAASAHNLDTLYSACESAVSNKSVSGLWTAVKAAAKDGFSGGSYDGLNEWYKTTDIRSDGKIHDYYSNATNFTPGTDQCGSYSGEGSCYNREHSIPKSWWGGGTSNQGCDIYIVVPTDGYVNNRRSAFPFGEVSSPTYSSKNGFCKLGPNTFSGYTGTAFEPNDEYKGDFARIYFYAVSKWDSVNFASGGQGDTTFNKNGTYGLTDYGKNLMYKWHTLDPVSDWELSRQDKCELKQGNRNPFVDHPEYADYLWGGVEIGSETSDDPSLTVSPTTLSVEVNGTETVTATKRNTTDTIYWSITSGSSNISLSASTGSNVTVTGLAEGSSTITVTCGSLTKTVSVTVTSSGGSGGDEPGPSEEGTYTITFATHSNDLGTEIGTSTDEDDYISSNTLTSSFTNFTKCYPGKSGIKLGSSSVAGSFTASVVSTAQSNIESITVKSTKYGSDTGTLSLKTGSTTLKSSWNPGTDMTYNFEDETGDYGTASSFTIATSSKRAYITSVSFTIASSSSKTLESIAVSNAQTVYTQGDTFAKPTVTATFDDESTANVTSSATFSGYNMSTVGTQTVNVSYTYGGTTKSTSYQITVKAPVTVSSLEITGSLENPTQFVGDTFDPNGITVIAHYSDNTEENVTSSVTWNPSVLTALTTSVVATYGGKSASVTGINVIYPAVTSLSTSGQKTTYDVGDTFAYNGTAIAKYENNTSKTVTPTVDSSNVNMNVVGTYTVGLSYTEREVTVSTSYTIQVKEVTLVNSIKECYSKAANTSVSNIYGLYVGTYDGHNPIIMNGEYGILIYNGKSATLPSWTVNETYVKVTSASIAVYNSTLWQLSGAENNCEVVTDETVIKNNIEPVTVYNVLGTENSTDNKDVASRLCMVSGEVIDVTKKQSGEISSHVNINGSSVEIYVKSDKVEYLEDDLVVGNDVTIKGFTTFYSTNFQIYGYESVKTDDNYTAEQFAQYLLSVTETVCTGNGNKENQLSPIWITLEFEKYVTLNTSQKLILQEADASDNGNTIQRAVARYDFIVSHYASCSDFIGRGIVFVGINNNFLLANQESIVPIVVIIAIIGVTSIGAIVLLKKRKEN